MEALNSLAILPSGKDEVKRFVQTIKSEILASTQNPLPILVKLKYVEKTISEILKDDEIDAHFLKDALLYAKDEKIVISGADLRVGETGVKYDYKASGDPIWLDLDKEIAELTEKRKEREKFLCAIPYDQGVVDPGSGLFITRPPKSSKTKCIVTIK